jgi:hypothetical protein
MEDTVTLFCRYDTEVWIEFRWFEILPISGPL